MVQRRKLSFKSFYGTELRLQYRIKDILFNQSQCTKSLLNQSECLDNWHGRCTSLHGTNHTVTTSHSYENDSIKGQLTSQLTLTKRCVNATDPTPVLFIGSGTLGPLHTCGPNWNGRDKTATGILHFHSRVYRQFCIAPVLLFACTIPYFLVV